MTMLNTTHATTTATPSLATLRRRRRAARPAVHVAVPLATRDARRALLDGAPAIQLGVEPDGGYLSQLDGPEVLFDRCA